MSVYRMLHSPAAQLEYAVCLGRHLQDLVAYAAELDRRQGQSDTKYLVTTATEEAELLTKVVK